MNRQAEQLRRAREAMRSGEDIAPSDFIRPDTSLPKTDIYDNADEPIPVAKEKSSGLDSLLVNVDKSDDKRDVVGAYLQDGEWIPSTQYYRLDDDLEVSSFDDALEYDW